METRRREQRIPWLTEGNVIVSDGSDERSLVLGALRGEAREREKLVQTYLPRIAGIAREYRGVRSVSREELMQAGVLGLLTALERYDTERENQFWTYARWWVRRSMQELVSSLNNAVVFSDRALRMLAQLKCAHRAHVQSCGSEPSHRDLAAVTGLKPAQVATLLGAAQSAHTLEDRSESERSWGRGSVEGLADPAGEDGFEHVRLRLASRALPAVLATLSPRERLIVRRRYGIDGATRSVRELAAELCVSPERVRQIEQKAMRKLRESCDATAVAA
jgi:RNA polymerase sigma factor (sigma-70 family)